MSCPETPSRRARIRIWLPIFAVVVSATSFGCRPTEAPQVPDTGPRAEPSPATTAQPAATDGHEYQTLPPEQREQPPATSPAPAWSFPTIHDAALPNGLRVKTVERRTLPLVQLTLVIRSGQATDGAKPGLALLAGEMLKVGGTHEWTSAQLLDRIESLGSELNVITSRDSTTISLGVTSDRFDQAIDLLGLVVQKPRFSDSEFRKLAQREADRVASHARTNAGWAASMALFRELYRSASGNSHPYATFDATPEQIRKLALWEVKNWVQTHVSPKNATLVVAGDVPSQRVAEGAQRALGRWQGQLVVKPAVPTPQIETGGRIFLVHRPKSSQAELRLALFGPAHQDEDYVAARVANQVLGGGVAGRLFLDVREKRSLAYSTHSSLERVAHGPQPFILQAGTQTAKAGLTLRALLEHASGMTARAPNEQETSIASRFLADTFLLRMESVGSLGSMVAALATFDLPNDYYDRYREAVARTTAADVARVGERTFGQGRWLIVVAGDADRLGTPLSHFGPVTVLDPNAQFKTIRELPHDPTANIELDRVDGT